MPGSETSPSEQPLHEMPYAGPVSAGILMYRELSRPRRTLEVYIVHPGGPYFAAHRDRFWGVPKGIVDDGESLQEAAVREFTEETGFEPPAPEFDLGSVRGRRGKTIHCYAARWDRKGDPPEVNSNLCTVEWPPASGTLIEIPEIDEGRFMTIDRARSWMGHVQQEFLDRLIDWLKVKDD